MAADHVSRLSGRVLSAIVDPTIVLSFGRTGLLVHRTQFDARDLEVDLTGKVCLVTGGSSGIGRATANGLARHGATVWILCRDEARGETHAESIRRDTENPEVHVARIDLASHDSIREVVETLPEHRIDVLVHNAGVLLDERRESPDGIEQTLATHLIGPFLLTWLLLPRLRAAGAARLIHVSSGGMYTQRLEVVPLRHPPEPFDGVVQYARAKRAMVVLNELWARRLLRDGIDCHCMHPGWVQTPGVERSLPRFARLMRPLLRTPEEGADTILWLAACERIRGRTGLFWFDRAPRRTHYVPWTHESPGERARLWDMCCELADVGTYEPG